MTIVNFTYQCISMYSISGFADDGGGPSSEIDFNRCIETTKQRLNDLTPSKALKREDTFAFGTKVTILTSNLTTTEAYLLMIH